MQNDKLVTKEEFEGYLNSYPREMKKHTVSFFDPPLVTWNDFSLGEYPEFSIVAYAKLSDDGTLYDYTIKAAHLTPRALDVCPTCKGSGEGNSNHEVGYCPDCNGTGKRQ